MKNILGNIKTTVLLLTIAAISAVVFCCSQNQNTIEPAQAQGINGVLRVHPTNPRYFTDDSGKAIYLTGSHTWTNFQDFRSSTNPNFNWTEYLNFLESHNHNFIRLWVVEYEYDIDNDVWAWPNMYQRTGPGSAYDGRPKYDLTKLNQDYFDRLESRISSAQERGIYVDIMLFDSMGAGYGSNSDDFGLDNREAWKSHPFRLENNINNIDADSDNDGLGTELHTLLAGSAVTNLQKEYIRKVVETVNQYDNVLYEIGNELPYDSIQFQYDMIDYIHSLESSMPKQHPVGMTAGGPLVDGGWQPMSFSDLANSNADWISPNNERGKVDYKTNILEADGSKVIILDTDHIEVLFTANRDWVWRAFCRGHNPVYMDVYQLPFPYNSIGDNSWNDPDTGLGYPLEVRPALGHAKAYADKMNFAEMTPQGSLSSTDFILANQGSEYLVYQPISGSFTVNLIAGDYYYEWFNPNSGSVAETGTITASGGSMSFAPPFSSSAVLYLKKAQDFPLGLIGHWKFDEGSGSIAFDSSAYEGNGVINDAVWTADSKTGSYALAFDGIDDYVITADTDSLDSVSNAVTVAAWVKRSSDQDNWRVIAQRQVGTGSTEHYLLGFSNNSYRWLVNTTNGYSDTSLGSLANNNEWVHMAGTYDGSEVKLYINGEIDFTDDHTGAFSSDSSPITIGAGNNSGSMAEFFNGTIDDVKIYNEALSAEEVLALYNEAQPAYLLPDLDHNNFIDASDLAQLKSSWGTNQADFNNDSQTDAQDLGIMMSVWGSY